MPKYRVCAYEPDGSFAFAATLQCADDAQACEKFNGMALDGCSAELLLGDRVVATRAGEAAASRAARAPLRRRAAQRG